MSFFADIKQISSAIKKHPLAKKHTVLAIFNFLKWQISQRISPGIKEMPFVGGTFLSVKKGMTGATGNIYFGLHEFEDMGFLLHFLREDDLFVDIGSNIGSYTVLASGVCKASSVSLEPVPQTFKYLQNNIVLNNISNRVNLLNAAAGAARGKLKFTSGLDTVNHVISSDENDTIETIEADVFTADDILADNKKNILIKIDAEGFETEVLKGMTSTLKNDLLKAIIIELNGSGERYGYKDEVIHLKLKTHGFFPYSYDPFLRKLSLLETYSATNTIYIREESFVNDRLYSANKITVFSESF
jgi:FkbM family methyltransferase